MSTSSFPNEGDSNQPSAIQVAALPLAGNYAHDGDENDAIAEWAVAVEWTHTVPKTEAFWRTGMFANQNTVAKLRQSFTIEQVTAAFGLDD